MGLFRGILNLLFPPRCAFCRKITGSGTNAVCDDCQNNLPRTTDGGRQSGDYYTACYSPLYYEDRVRDSILMFKFSSRSGYAPVYGRYIAECITENLEGKYDLISWVPLSEERLKSRGYDQAMLLALSTALELGDVAVETLTKHLDVPAQSGIGSEENRRANISGAYMASDEELIKDKRILLVDDIVTTGSTLSECAKVLLEAGADEVLCVTLAKTRE